MKDDGSKAINDLNFFLRGGQILGVAGIAGCGQKELCEAIVGLRKYDGDITHYGNSIKNYSPEQIKDIGIRMSFIPEDRLGLGLAPNLSIVDNLLLKSYQKKKGIFVDRKSAAKEAQELVDRYFRMISPFVFRCYLRCFLLLVHPLQRCCNLRSVPHLFRCFRPSILLSGRNC